MPEQELRRVVITTGRGRSAKYHHPDCNIPGEKTREMDVEVARQFYDACQRCLPDRN